MNWNPREETREERENPLLEFDVKVGLDLVDEDDALGLVSQRAGVLDPHDDLRYDGEDGVITPGQSAQGERFPVPGMR